ncbi:MAG: TonB C-terminal domain-containing protein [SAR324 cluster bacterium]|jgi:hypothetical protein|nr:TonB C-terminal domain-containing protein [SAR324 cluster bacterium]MCH2267093.1 TonB C-terminal domain-containing protein [SAR324 cluster bacterium]|tara:strand:+ start:557 stop:1306 length:750 start_codon:yes stop_codon:yes gene_type:complete
MTLKWRFSGGILFSVTLHVILLSALLLWYPGIINKSDWQWEEWSPFSANETAVSGDDGFTSQESLKKMSAAKLIYPDTVLLGQPILSRIKKKKVIPKISLKSILTQVAKFPDRLKVFEVSKKPLSAPVTKLLSLLTPVTLQNTLPEKERPNLNARELKEYHQELKGYLSERWEVPIHLIESQFTAVIQFEIKKNGRLLSWKMKDSANSALNKTLKNLLKNLQFLPSLPESYPEDSYKFGVRFTPANFQL